MLRLRYNTKTQSITEDAHGTQLYLLLGYVILDTYIYVPLYIYLIVQTQGIQPLSPCS
jgi:hypothetical protein